VRGGLAHAALRDTLEGLRERRGSARLTPASLALALELLSQSLAQNEADFPLSVLPERVPGARRRLAADLERYLRHAAAQQSPLEPKHLELGFGFEEEPMRLAALELAPGVRLRGRIDRIDLSAQGDAVVYDYKGASVTPASGWLEQGKVQLALYMRAAEELLGLRVVGGFYQPLAGSDMRARGVLERESGLELPCVRTDMLERQKLQELLAGALELAREAAEQALGAEVRARPRSCTPMGRCEYPSICRHGR
jgi:ATP-dependent helicase/nuclease subunit B